MATATHRIVNFSAGPAILPAEVMEEVALSLRDLAGTGIGVAEHSHRGKAITAVLRQAEADCRELLGVGDEFAVVFTTGGASSQFFVVPQNFLQGGTANYIDTGVWSSKAIKEAKAFGNVHLASTSKAEGYTHIPKTHDFAPGAAYTHYTSNNTIYGTQFHADLASDSPVVCDASSDMMSRPLDMSRYAMIYAGAQKNLGPAGVTLVVVRRDFAEKGAKNIPAMLQYRTHIEGENTYNTPPVLPIYIMGLVFKWLKKNGGLAAMAAHNQRKAAVLYNLLDSSDFWRTPAAKADRSLMNVVFRLGTEELEAKLISEAKAAGFDGIKGHRSAGGLRASIYNAMPVESVESFVSFLREFERTNG
jgi:phosphoserine aminotransferase